MAKKIEFGSSKRFGPRYGRTNREKYAKIEKMQKSSYKCPYCMHKKVKRVNLGIWYCDTCKAKFTSKAYSVPKVKATI